MLRAIISYEKDKILHSSKLIIPVIVMAAYFGIGYAIAPVNILSSFSICSLIVYFFMLSVGVMNDDLNNPMIDQTILVKMRHKSNYYLGKVFIIAIISFLLALISVAVPLLINVLENNMLFNRSVVASDIVSGIVLLWLVGLSGGVSGLYANHRIIRNRKIAVVLSALLGLFVVIEGPIVQQLSEIGYITWLFPPVYDLTVAYSKNSYFSINSTRIFFLWMIVYIIIETTLYVIIMLKKRFE